MTDDYYKILVSKLKINKKLRYFILNNNIGQSKIKYYFLEKNKSMIIFLKSVGITGFADYTVNFKDSYINMIMITQIEYSKNDKIFVDIINHMISKNLLTKIAIKAKYEIKDMDIMDKIIKNQPFKYRCLISTIYGILTKFFYLINYVFRKLLIILIKLYYFINVIFNVVINYYFSVNVKKLKNILFTYKPPMEPIYLDIFQLSRDEYCSKINRMSLDEQIEYKCNLVLKKEYEGCYYYTYRKIVKNMIIDLKNRNVKHSNEYTKETDIELKTLYCAICNSLSVNDRIILDSLLGISVQPNSNSTMIYGLNIGIFQFLSIFNRKILQVDNIKILNNKLDNLKLENRKLNNKLADLELKVSKLKLQLETKETDNIISYDYEEIKSRNLSLHRELKRLYRLINRNKSVPAEESSVKENEFKIPFARIVKSL